MADDSTPLLAKLRVLRDEWGDAAVRAALADNPTLSPEQRNRFESLICFGSDNQIDEVTIGDIAGRDLYKKIEGNLTLSDDARINGVAVSINLGTIIYRRDPKEEERRHLAHYLACLAAKLHRLPLSALAARLDDGEGMALARVYVELATTGQCAVYPGSDTETRFCIGQNLTEHLKGYLQGAELPLRPAGAYDRDHVLPRDAIVAISSERVAGYGHEPDMIAHVRFWRARLATEAIATHTRLILLGDPGSGKSTFLRHLAWALAQRGLDQPSALAHLRGWADDLRLMPIFLPLRRLANQIVGQEVAPGVVTASLVREMEHEYGARDSGILLNHALANGSALLLFDGLDEIPLEATATSAGRRATLQVLRGFADLYPTTKMVITCRTRALSADLGTYLGWDVETIAPFTLGQIRHFIQVWFATLRVRGSLDYDKAARHTQALTDVIIHNERLRHMAGTPLLLTMMALVLMERGELPRDRSLLYEEVLRQLLGEWDVQKGGQSLADVLGAPNLRGDDLRPILDRLSFEAHAGVISNDGRGRLPARDLRLNLTEYLEAVRVPGAWEAAGRCLTYFSERSALLLPEDDGSSYTFVHLTLQEHGAGRHLLLQPNAVRAVMERRADDRWREPIALGMGVVQRLYSMLADRIDRIFTELIDPDEDGRPKERVRWYRDLIMAAELGKERDWDLLRALINVDRLLRDLRHGLVAVLADIKQPLPSATRVCAGFFLGDLGDPRFPVTIEQWQREITRAHAGVTNGYFCPLPSRTGVPSLWIARYLVTNAQMQAWQRDTQQLPLPLAHDTNFNQPNQPVAGVNWFLAAEFCTWLEQQTGTHIRLPSESEWQIAAYGDDGRRYPWGNIRDTDRAAIKEDRDQRGWPYPVPVGCYPAGASAVGALDMAGNVWEWTADVWPSDAELTGSRSEFQPRVLRGGGYRSKKSQTSATGRIRQTPHIVLDYGFRVVLDLHDHVPVD